MSQYNFYSSCVGWPNDDIDNEGGLRDLVENRTQISRETLIKHIGSKALREFAKQLGYETNRSKGLVMADDWHIEYFKSKHHGEVVYGFRHSAIEFVFKR